MLALILASFFSAAAALDCPCRLGSANCGREGRCNADQTAAELLGDLRSALSMASRRDRTRLAACGKTFGQGLQTAHPINFESWVPVCLRSPLGGCSAAPSRRRAAVAFAACARLVLLRPRRRRYETVSSFAEASDARAPSGATTPGAVPISDNRAPSGVATPKPVPLSNSRAPSGTSQASLSDRRAPSGAA